MKLKLSRKERVSPFAENEIKNEETISSETSKPTYADILKKGLGT